MTDPVSLNPAGQPLRAVADATEANEPLTRMQAARIAAGLKVADVAARTRLSPKQVESLEAERWNELPGHAFVRGALRSWARTVGADVSEQLGSIGGHAQAADIRDSASLHEPMNNRGPLGVSQGLPNWVWMGGIGLAILTALGLYFGQRDAGPRPRTVTESGAADTNKEGVRGPNAPVPTVPGTGVTAPTAPASIAVPNTPTTGSSSPAPATEAGIASNPVPSASVATPQTPVNPAIPAPAGAATTGAGVGAGATAAAAAAVLTEPAKVATASEAPTLSLQFTRNAWVEVKQADGKVLTSKMYPANSQVSFTPQGAVQITLGSASTSSVTWKGKKQNLAPFVRDDVARLKLE